MCWLAKKLLRFRDLLLMNTKKEPDPRRETLRTANPSAKQVSVGQAATFSVVATGTVPLSYLWQKNGANITGARSPSYTTPATASADNDATFRVVVSNSVGSVTSNSATLTVNSAVAPGTDVTTYHNDNSRTGQNLTETTLTAANVNSHTFGLVRNLTVDGKVDAEPLYLSQLPVAGGIHNVLFIATEHDSLYAFDPDTGAQLWKVSMLGSGETTSDDRGCGQVSPEIGVTSTPVIDRNAGQHGIIYVIAMPKNGSAYFQRLHALDATTGAEILGGPIAIQATYPGTGANSSGGQIVFDLKQYKESRTASSEGHGLHELGFALRP
jgi:outer membrane protein assembly factor BamB